MTHVLYVCNTSAVGSDFCGEAVVLIFKADETLANPMAEATAYINITNDSINEADQVFVVEMQIQNGLDNSSALLLEHSICKIIDDDGKQGTLTPLGDTCSTVQ